MGGMNEPTNKFLDLVRDALRVRHYAFRTEQAYMFWIRRYILFHGNLLFFLCSIEIKAYLFNAWSIASAKSGISSG